MQTLGMELSSNIQVGHVVTAHWSGGFQECQIVLPPLVAAMLLFFTDTKIVMLLVFKSSTKLHRGDRIRTS